jgi:hypothetical protein
MRDVKNQEKDGVYTKLVHTDPDSRLLYDLTDEEYLDWLSDWLDKADEYHASSGNSPVFVGRAHIRRLFNLARQENDERQT